MRTVIMVFPSDPYLSLKVRRSRGRRRPDEFQGTGDGAHGRTEALALKAIRSLVAFRSIVAVDVPLLLRAVEMHETDRLDFAEAHLVACAESTGVGRVATFDRSIDRVQSVQRALRAVSRRAAGEGRIRDECDVLD